MKKILLILMAFVLSFGVKAQQLDVNAAKQLVIKNSAAIGMSATDLQNFRVNNAYTNEGVQMVYLNQDYKGLPIFNQMRVLQFKNGELNSNAGGFIADAAASSGNSSGTASIDANTAIQKAFAYEGLSAPIFLKQPQSAENGHSLNYGIIKGVNENLTARLLWVPVEQGKTTMIKLAWQVQLAPENSNDLWLINVNALNGAIISKMNLTVNDIWDKNPTPAYLRARNIVAQGSLSPVNNINTNTVHAASSNRPDLVGTANYLVVPFPAESPTHPGGTPAVRTNPWTHVPGNATFLQWQNDGTTDYTITRGNNVWATEDVAGANTSTGPIITPTGLPATSTTTPDPLNFNFPPDFTQDPRTAQNQQFTITNLFYWNNNMHDMSYVYGFNEVSANFQNNNHSLGGSGNDYVIALAQSSNQGAIGNNANFRTPAEGGRGRMCMYLFTGTTGILHANAPASLAGDYTALEGAMSTANLLANVGPVTAPVVWYNDDASGTTHYACNPPANSLTGKIALISRGFGGICTSTVSFITKVHNAQNAGAVGVIMVNNVPGALVLMGGPDNAITIPAVMVSDVDGATLAAAAGTTLNVTLKSATPLDGDLDAGVMCHEYTHGISNRFTGGGSGTCLGNAEEGGEGWSDFFALMMTQDWVGSNVNSGTAKRPMGTYVFGQAPTGGGIRLYPYSTDITIDPLTYANVGNGTVGTEVHNIGEVWCMSLWEMTWAIIQQENSINTDMFTFNQATTTGGNSIALKLVLEGMRLQPCQPGFIDARDAILKADRNLYCGKHACSIWTAFAKRGMGYGSSQGSSNSATDQTSTTTMPPAPTIVTSPVSQTVSAGANVTFTANATPADVNMIYQWQLSTDGGGDWNDISCSITSSLTVNAVTASMNGYLYRVRAFIGCAQTTTAVATLTVTSSTPSITLTSGAGTNNQTVCVNSPITNIVYSTAGGVTNASAANLPAGVTGVYNAGTFTISGTPTATGTFNYTVTTAGGSPNATATGTIIVNSRPAVPTVTSPVVYCQGATAVPLTATGTALLWYTVASGGTGSATAPTPSTTTVGSTTYYVSQTTSTCEGPRASITVTINAVPAAPAVTTPVNYCQNAAAVPLTATGTNLLWYTVATGGTGSATAPTPSTTTVGTTTYYVSQTSGTCEGPRAAIVVNVNSSTPAPTVVSPVTYCQNGTAVALTATGTNLLWYAAATGGVGSATAPTPSTTTVGSTTYYVSQTSSCGESPRAAIVVNVTAPPAAPTVSSPVTYCQNATAVPLTATGTGLLWYTAATGGTGSATAPTPSTATVGSTSYYVSQTVGCESPRAQIVVTVNATPAAPTVTSPVTYCQGAAAVALTATGTNLLWYTAATGGVGSATAPTPSTAAAGSTTYYVSQTTTGCESPRAAIVVTVNPSTTAPTVSSPVTYCQGATAAPLTATGTGLLWYTAATGGVGSATAPTPSTATAGNTIYYVSQTGACGEGPRASVTVVVNATPAAPTVSSPVAYCQGATAVQLTATGTNLLWYTTATGGTGSATAPTPSTTTVGSTTYYVSQTASTCEGPRAAIVVNVTALPGAPTVTSPVTYCQGATAVALTATGTNLLWYTAATGGVGSATAPTPSTAAAGTTIYYVSSTTATCEGPRAAITVNITALPAAPTVSSPVTYCQGSAAVPLTATGTNLLWYTTATGGAGSATAPTPSTATIGSTIYYVSQTASTCEGPRAAIVVNITAATAAPAVTTPVVYCQGSTAVPLTATGTGLLWYTAATGGTGSATAPTPSTATVGSTTYYVSQTVTCESPRAAIVVTVNATPGAPTVTTPVNYCQGSTTVPLTATGTNLKWYTVATGGTGSATAPTPSSATVGSTTYYVSQTTGACEGARAAIVVNVTTGAVITGQPSDITSCATSATFTVTATGTNLSYQWQVSTDGGTTYTSIPGANSATLVLNNLTPAQSNYKYHVVVTAAGCGAVTSNAVSAHVGTAPVVVLTAAPSTVYNPAHNGGLYTTVSPVGNYTYQWTRDGVVLATGAPYITAANGLLYDFGTYSVSVTDVATGCTGLSNSVTIVDVPGDRGHLFISPNPTNGIVHVSFYSSTTAVQTRGISVYDDKGARVMTTNFSITGRYADMTIDLTGKPAGTYMLILRDTAGKKIAEGEVVKF